MKDGFKITMIVEEILKSNKRIVDLQVGLRHAPALQHGNDLILSHQDDIIDYIDREFPIPSLKCECSAASDATANLFRSFAFFIKEVNTDPKVRETSSMPISGTI